MIEPDLREAWASSKGLEVSPPTGTVCWRGWRGHLTRQAQSEGLRLLRGAGGAGDGRHARGPARRWRRWLREKGQGPDPDARRSRRP